jgi:hypothetical protein
MTVYECEKCDRTFASKSHYVYHTEKLKTPCVNSKKSTNKKVINVIPKKKDDHNKIIKNSKDDDTESESDDESETESESDDKSSNETKIDIINNKNNSKNIFSYKDNNFMYIIDINQQIYFKGKDIAEFLEYSNTKKALIDHIREKHKFEFVLSRFRLRLKFKLRVFKINQKDAQFKISIDMLVLFQNIQGSHRFAMR